MIIGTAVRKSIEVQDRNKVNTERAVVTYVGKPTPLRQLSRTLITLASEKEMAQLEPGLGLVGCWSLGLGAAESAEISHYLTVCNSNPAVINSEIDPLDRMRQARQGCFSNDLC